WTSTTRPGGALTPPRAGQAEACPAVQRPASRVSLRCEDAQAAPGRIAVEVEVLRPLDPHGALAEERARDRALVQSNRVVVVGRERDRPFVCAVREPLRRHVGRCEEDQVAEAVRAVVELAVEVAQESRGGEFGERLYDLVLEREEHRMVV